MDLFWVMFLFFLFVWVLLNILAPYAVIARSTPISIGRLPSELLTGVDHRQVKFYTANLIGGYGYSVWAPPLNLVIFDKVFFAKANPALIRYVIAHELAHFDFGHHRKRWFCIVTGIVVFKWVRVWLREMEEEADVEAARRTGFHRSLFPELV